MRPNDAQLNPHVDMPAWLLALQQALHEDGPDPPPELLTSLDALGEVTAVARASLPESSDDRTSLQSDVGRALENLGPNARNEAAAALHDFRQHTLGRLPAMLATEQGAPLVAAAAESLAARLVSDPVAAAAWRDVVSSFEDDDPYETCALRIAVLRELLDARGHAVEAEVVRLARIINDSAGDIASSGGKIAPPANGERYELTERGGLSEVERLRLIERHIRHPPGEEQAVVWLVFFDAVVADHVIQVGPVRFIDARHMREQLELKPPQLRAFDLPSGPPGLLLAAQLFEDIGESDQAVIARVETTTRRGQAIEWARRTASGLLDAATVGQPHLGWRLADGYLLASERLWSHQRLRRGGVPRMSRFYERLMYRPDTSLAALDSRLVAAWETGRDDAIEAVELARWHRAVTALPDLHFRLALGVRNLERTLPGARLIEADGRTVHWSRIVAFYLKERWCWMALEAELDELRVHAVSPSPRSIFEGDQMGQENDVEEMLLEAKLAADARVWNDLAAITGTKDLTTRAGLVTHASAIAELMPVGSSRRRLLEALAADTADTRAVERWLNRLARRFDTLLARAARQRNAVLHGGGTHPTVVARTLPFVEDLALLVVRDALAAATESTSLPRYLEQRHVDTNERRGALAAGKRLVDLV